MVSIHWNYFLPKELSLTFMSSDYLQHNMLPTPASERGIATSNRLETYKYPLGL